ncbi:MAG: hypothetical protein CEE43_09295 [Promethearchaeota archaeon Loki_b32]|nr:MAG: hypothetical protein CEE43_09295 [Candidatus Lokiarchaeota archaeon Loki_b32]
MEKKYMIRNNLMKRYILIIIGVLTILGVFLLPFGIMIDLAPQGPNSIVSMIWEVPLSPAWYSVRFFSAFLYYFEFVFFRLVFVIYVLLLIVGKYNKIQFFLIGIISEIVPLVLSIPRIFIRNSDGDNLFVIIFPIPILMIFDLILVLLLNRLKFNDVNN